MNRRHRLVIACAALLAGCSGPAQKSTLSNLFGKPTPVPREGRHTAKSFSVELPAGWVRKTLNDDTVAASLDGFLLQSIVVEQRNLDKAFPKTRKIARTDALSTELAELEIAELKASGPQMAALEVMQNEPATLSGEEGYRLTFRHRTSRGLVIQHVVQGCVTRNGYFRLEYAAPALHYFAPTLPEFDKSAASFTLIAASTPARK
ncbi:MAG: hypothetical protein U1F52_12900 [Burkholderiales bacterium]